MNTHFIRSFTISLDSSSVDFLGSSVSVEVVSGGGWEKISIAEDSTELSELLSSYEEDES